MDTERIGSEAEDDIPAYWPVNYAFSILAVCAAGIAGKYVWLLALCRVLNWDNVGPLIACGRPPRIGRFDRSLVRRFYHRQGPGLQARLRPPKAASYTGYLHAAAYGGGALLSAAVRFFPLMRGDSRPWQLAIFFGFLAVIFWALARFTKEKP